MADIQLAPLPALGGADIAIGANRILERDDLALVSVAVPLGGDAALAAALKSAWSLEMPSATESTSTERIRALPLGPDQLMLMFPHATPDAESQAQDQLKGTGYTTDQTGGWVVLEISGPDTLAALERICLLDLAQFKTGSVARSMMDHMGVTILRLASDRFLLLSASSSAGSFLECVESSYRNVV